MPASRARTIRQTTAMLNSTCAAITVHMPIWKRKARTASTKGLMMSNNVTKATSVAMPITTLGTMIAM